MDLVVQENKERIGGFGSTTSLTYEACDYVSNSDRECSKSHGDCEKCVEAYEKR